MGFNSSWVWRWEELLQFCRANDKKSRQSQTASSQQMDGNACTWGTLPFSNAGSAYTVSALYPDREGSGNPFSIVLLSSSVLLFIACSTKCCLCSLVLSFSFPSLRCLWCSQFWKASWTACWLLPPLCIHFQLECDLVACFSCRLALIHHLSFVVHQYTIQ